MRPSPAHPGSAAPAGGAIDWAKALGENERWLRKVVLARVGAPDAVDEVFQEVSLAAAAQTPGTVAPSSVAPWLYGVAVRQAILHRRRRGREKRLQDRIRERAAGAPPPGDPLEWLLLEERREIVQRALAKLPPGRAEILTLKYGEGWSYGEIALRLGITESAVESRLHRARRLLRDEIQRTSSEAP
jgi:RNA polymerase sigma-70 factor (ECF subfamily)